MTEPAASGSKFFQFWTTFPGVLTAVAAVITAGGGVYFAAQGGEATATDRPPTLTTVYNVNLTADAGSRPAEEVEEAALDLDDLSTAELTAEQEVEQYIADCSNGDETACEALLDSLVDECSEGYGVSCDALYVVSSEGSDYESFGATCGGRFDDVEMAGSCADVS